MPVENSSSLKVIKTGTIYYVIYCYIICNLRAFVIQKQIHKIKRYKC